MPASGGVPLPSLPLCFPDVRAERRGPRQQVRRLLFLACLTQRPAQGLAGTGQVQDAVQGGVERHGTSGQPHGLREVAVAAVQFGPDDQRLAGEQQVPECPCGPGRLSGLGECCRAGRPRGVAKI